MSNLPFLSLNDDFLLNSFEVLILLGVVSLNRKKVPTLNNGKIQAFLYLIKHPSVLNMILRDEGRPEVQLRDSEINSVKNLSVNVDDLYREDKVKEIVRFGICSKLIEVCIHNNEAVYKLSSNGGKVVSDLNSTYFGRLKEFAVHTKPLRSKSVNQLNSLIGNKLRKYG